MKAKTAVLTAVETAEVIDRELPELGEHDVLVKIDANNICTSEYGAFNGARKRPLPLVFGHEWAGTVVEVGSAVDSVAVGDYIASGYQYDPYSEPSREGRTSECTKLQSADHPNPDGYFGNAGCANYAVAKEVACYKIDKGIDPSVAALLEPLGTCCAGFRRFGIEYGQTVVVIGAGTMGVLNALVAKAHGCRVIITEMMPKKLETAAKLGLETIDVSKCDPVEKVRELTGGKGADGVIDRRWCFGRLCPGPRDGQGEARPPAYLRSRIPGAQVGTRPQHRALSPHGHRGLLRCRRCRLPRGRLDDQHGRS